MNINEEWTWISTYIHVHIKCIAESRKIIIIWDSNYQKLVNGLMKNSHAN